MKLLFAQGNPGKQYQRSRHNIGFMVIDYIAAHYGASFVTKTKFNALVADITIDDEKILLVKPQTFYNETGTAARALVDFYHINPSKDMLAIHDDHALPFGTIRVRNHGSDAGNNGVKSLNRHVGDQYWRLRIGTSSDSRQVGAATSFVLGSFTQNEETEIKEYIIPTASRLCDDFIKNKLEPTSISQP